MFVLTDNFHPSFIHVLLIDFWASKHYGFFLKICYSRPARLTLQSRRRLQIISMIWQRDYAEVFIKIKEAVTGLPHGRSRQGGSSHFL
jgi:hypothetical protein